VAVLYLQGKVVIVVGNGDDLHRGVVVALAEAGADVAIAGIAPDLSAEAALHSIANEIWAMGRRSVVVTFSDDADFTNARDKVIAELGGSDFVIRCDIASN
jgi:meso-butanediol dehydrogenase/(S,S)-butanediol dehydrogenase/diacetyl reductase